MPPIQVTFSAPLTVAGQVVRLALALTVILGMAFGRPSAVPVREILVFALVVVPIPLWLTLRWLGDRAHVPWLFRRPVPSVTLDERMLELCLPVEGCRVFDLDAIGRAATTSRDLGRRCCGRLPTPSSSTARGGSSPTSRPRSLRRSVCEAHAARVSRHSSSSTEVDGSSGSRGGGGSTARGGPCGWPDLRLLHLVRYGSRHDR